MFDPNQPEFALIPYTFLAYAGSKLSLFSQTLFLMILFTFKIKTFPLQNMKKPVW